MGAGVVDRLHASANLILFRSLDTGNGDKYNAHREVRMSTIRLSYTAVLLGIFALGTATFSAPASAAKYKFTPAFQDVLAKAKKEG